MIDPIPVLPPAEAIAYFRRKGLAIGFDWQDIWQGEHAHKFTVAKAMSRSLLEVIRAALDDALANGGTLEQFGAGLRPELERRGWWGKRSMVDPLTGEQQIVQLGSPPRLKTIFSVNMRVAYQAGRWERFQRTKKALPYLRYVSVLDGRERPEHHAWHGTILPIDHSWWQRHYPPCGWLCRCTVQALNQRTIDREGWSVTEQPVAFPARPYVNKRTGEVSSVEQGIDPGWSYNVGESYLDGLAPAKLPAGFDGPIATAARLDRPEIAEFLAPFDLAIGESRIFTDRGGWPLAISAGWFRDAAGAIRVPPGATADQLGRVARAIVAPVEIRWRWVTAEDGSAVLMRRYRAGPVVVDVGAPGWRFRFGDVVAAAYDPSQPRRADGRWGGSAGSAFAAAAQANPSKVQSQIAIGEVPVSIARQMGQPPDKRSVLLDHGLCRHMLAHHSAGERDRGQVPVTTEDIGRSHRLLGRATSIAPGVPPVGKQGHRRFIAKATHRDQQFTIIAESRKRGILIITMWKKPLRA